MLDLLKYRYFYLLLSGLIILPGLIFIGLGGLKPGIDFRGGTQITVVMPKGVNPTTAAVVSVVRSVTYTNSAGKKVLFDDVEAQGVTDPAYKGQQEFLIRVPDIGSDVVAQQNLLSALKNKWGNVKQVSLDSVSGTVGADTTNRAIQAVIAAAVAILLYMAFAFRKLPHPFVYGGAAIAALLHDGIVDREADHRQHGRHEERIDALFVPAVLTVIGFSVHDTIVVFDRIRENMGRRTGEPYYTVVNNSLAQTLGRSLNTSLTVLLTLIALLLFGGSSIRIFVLTLLIGITSGTYSSIFNATPLAVMWETGEIPRLFGGGRGKKKPATTTPSTTRPRTVGTRAR